MTEVLTIDPEVVIIPEKRARALNEHRVLMLMDSFQAIGPQVPITIRTVPDMVVDGVAERDVPVLVAGRHRLEAALRLGIDLPYQEIDGVDAELWEIAENLHRAELTKLEHDEHVTQWGKLMAQKISDNLSENPKRGRPGVAAAAARDLGIGERDVQRAVKVASLSPEAKSAARETRLDDNRSVLLQAARAPAAEQAAVIRNIAAEKARSPQERRPARGPDYVLPERGNAALPLLDRLTDQQRQFLAALRDLVGQHLQDEFPEEDAGGAREILEWVSREVADNVITGAKHRAAHPEQAA